MQGWNEQTGWEDGGDWADRPDNGAAFPAAHAGHPEARPGSYQHPAEARRGDDRDERHGDARWADEPDDLSPSAGAAWSDELAHSTSRGDEATRQTDWVDGSARDTGWSEESARDTGRSDEPARDTDWVDGSARDTGWGDEPARDTGWGDEPGRGPEPGAAGWVDGVTERWRRAGLDPVDEPAGRRQQAAARWADEPADLGAFELGRDTDTVPGRRLSTADRQRDAEASDRGSSGRHRRPTPLRGPVGLGVAVTALLGVFGVGAALLPPSLTDAPAGNRGGQPAVEAAGPEESTDTATPDPTGTPEQTAAPTPTATATRPTPKPKASTSAPKPPRTTSPAARRTPARSGSGAGATGGSQAASQVLTIVNRERTANGCGTVTLNGDLNEAAQLHSQDQGEHTNMSHDGSDGSDFVVRARRAGYDRPMSENVAMGYETAAAVMEGWMNSSGHRRNILNCDAKAMGVGVATGADGRLYWTQMFGAVA